MQNLLFNNVVETLEPEKKVTPKEITALDCPVSDTYGAVKSLSMSTHALNLALELLVFEKSPYDLVIRRFALQASKLALIIELKH